MISSTMLRFATLFVFSAIFLYLTYLFAASSLYFWKTRLCRKRRRHERIIGRLRRDGVEQRSRLAATRQRRYMRELAASVNERLERKKNAIPPWTRQRITVVIERAVAEVEFGRLFSLHQLLGQTEDAQLRPALDRFFQQEG